LAAVLVLDSSVKGQYGNTIAVAVFALTVYKVTLAICAGIFHKAQKAAAAVKACIAINVVAIKVAVCQECFKAATAAQAAQTHKKVVHGYTNMVTWHSVYFHTAHDATQTTVLDQHWYHHAE
jgi:hypothetical protein